MRNKSTSIPWVPVLYEDDSLLVVVKPAGIDTGDARDGSQSGLVELLTQLRDEACEKADRPNIKRRFHATNRLSRYESGILVLAKNLGMAQRIRSALKAGNVELEYTAVVQGQMKSTRLMLGSSPAPKNDPEARGKSSPTSKSRSRGGVATPSSRSVTQVTRVVQSTQRALVRCVTHVENTHILRAQLRGQKLRLMGDLLHDRSPIHKSQQATCLHLGRMVLEHPTTGANLKWIAPTPNDFNDAVDGTLGFERPLRAGVVRRLRCLAEKDTDCYRLLNGSVEDVRGLVVEKFGPVIILQVHEEYAALTEQLPRIAKWYLNSFDAHAVYLKRFVRNRTGLDHDLAESLREARPFMGKSVPEVVEVRERGLRFGIRCYDGFSVGLFLDQRENRSKVRETAGGIRMLNLFAYTCGFSVAAAVGGAEETVSIDVSAKHLDWGKANFELNDIQTGRHEFLRADSLEYLNRAKRQGRKFDLVVVDPPTFAHGRRGKGRFSIAEDLPGLLEGAIEVLDSGGGLLVSSNFRRLSRGELRRAVHVAARGRGVKVLEAPPLPDDFAVDPEYSKALWVRFE